MMIPLNQEYLKRLSDFRKNTLEKVEKHINSKQPKWDRAFVACLLGVLQNDAETFSPNMQTLCDLHARIDISKFLKIHCVFAYGMWVFAKHNMSEEAFSKIKLPEHKTFDKDYLIILTKRTCRCSVLRKS